MNGETLTQLREAIVTMNPDKARDLARKSLDEGMPAGEILNDALISALDQVGVYFKAGDYFLPDVLLCVRAYNEAFALLEPGLRAGEFKPRGKVLMGTVEGDFHDIGKNIFSALLQGNGFEVIDLGVNVPAERFLHQAREAEADIIGMSALLTTTIPAMGEVIARFTAEGLRDHYKFIVGGAPVTQRYADEIGADGYGEDAQSGVDLAKALLS